MAREADREKRAIWSRRLREFERVGGSVAVFCRREGVSDASFYQWRRRLGRTGARAVGDGGRQGRAAVGGAVADGGGRGQAVAGDRASSSGARGRVPSVRFVPVEITGRLSDEGVRCNGPGHAIPTDLASPSRAAVPPANEPVPGLGEVARDPAGRPDLEVQLVEHPGLEVHLSNGVRVTVPCHEVEAIEVVMRALVNAAREERPC